MNTVIGVVLLCVVLIAAADVIPVLSRTEVHDDAGQFTLRYTTGDGTAFSEEGVLEPTPDGKRVVLVKKGAYSYTSPEGVPVSVKYTSDATGFHPESDSIPVAPK